MEDPPVARGPGPSATQRATDESELGRVRHAPEFHRLDPVHEAERSRAEPNLVRVRTEAQSISDAMKAPKSQESEI